MTTLPAWLADTHVEQPRQALTLRQFEIIFPTVLDKMARGITLARVFKDDHRHLDVGAFRRWVRADRSREADFRLAEELQADQLVDECLDIADGVDNPLEDIARSRERISVRLTKARFSNRSKYADTKNIEFGGTISVTAALTAANTRAATVLGMVEDATLVTPAIPAPVPAPSPSLQIAQDDESDDE